jgi:hypothetical protein
MRIDCNDIPLGISTSIYELNKLKSGKLVNGLLEINGKVEPRRNYMITSMNVFNIIEHHDNFEHKNLLGLTKELSALVLVGNLCGLDCYIDLHMVDNNILLFYDKQIARDLKLDALLDGVSFSEEKVEIEVIL